MPAESTTDPASPETTSPRRQLRVPPLWALVVLMLFVVTGGLWLLWHEAQQRMKLVHYVQDRNGCVCFKIGGRIAECRRRSGHLSWSGAAPKLPDWLIDLLGPTLFYPITEVRTYVHSAEPAHELFELLDNQPQLRSLVLGQAVRDSVPVPSDISGISNLHLTRLVLLGPWIEDQSLPPLETMTTLEEVWLSQSTVTDDGLRHLAGIPNLKILELRECSTLTDSGLTQLDGLADLRLLKLTGCQVTREGIERLRQRLPQCEVHWEPASGDRGETF